MQNRITSWSIVRAFTNNCPNVRLTTSEKEELARLIKVYGDERAKADTSKS